MKNGKAKKPTITVDQKAAIIFNRYMDFHFPGWRNRLDLVRYEKTRTLWWMSGRRLVRGLPR